MVLYLLLYLLFPGASRLQFGAYKVTIYLAVNAALLTAFTNLEPMVTVSWTLSYLVMFYLCCPLVVRGLGLARWRPSWRVAAVLAAAVGWIVLCRFVPLSERPVQLTAGILTYEARRSRWLRAGPSMRWEWAAIAPLVAALALWSLLNQRRWLAHAGLWNVIARHGAVSIGMFCSAVFYFDSRSRIAGVLSGVPFRALGQMSYTYYLLHGLAILVAARILGRIVPPISSRRCSSGELFRQSTQHL